VGLLTPLNLLYALSLVALVAIYLRARSRPTIEVSSLMLFEEIPAPVAKSRLLRLDALFWLEALALGAMSLAVAGLYVRSHQAVGPNHRHALVFDLGAGMGAVGENGITRLSTARQLALRIIAQAPAGDQFTVLGYALEAEATHAAGSQAPDARKALAALVPTAVAARPAALRAALIHARAADQIDLFADRPPPAALIDDAHVGGRLIFHKVGAPASNMAIVSLDGGVPRSSVGRCVVRNFTDRPQVCELVIEAAGREVFHSKLVAEPRAEIVVPFGPLSAGGIVHARIATPDALAADNQRWALAPSIAHQHALVLSPDAAVRDDLARVVLAINRNFLVTAADPARPDSFDHARRYDLAVIHDSAETGVNAAARLLIFPPPLSRSHGVLVPATHSVAIAELQERAGAGILSAPVLLGAARVIEPPAWMEPMARGVGVREHDSFPLAAIGSHNGDAVGVLAFDVRDHLLLDPDRMDALVLTIDLLQRLLAPRDVMIEPTGTFVTVAAGAHARVTAPDGSMRPLEADPWGRVRFRALESGRYLVTSNGPATAVYANYFDAGESDLSAPVPATERPAPSVATAGPSQLSVRPLALPLVILALLALIGESIMLAQRAVRWRAAHV